MPFSRFQSAAQVIADDLDAGELVDDFVEAVHAGGGEEAAGDALDDRAARLDAGLLLVGEPVVEAFPEGEVEIVLGLDLDLVAGAEHARPAKIVEHRIGRDLGGERVVEADIGGDLGALDRLEQVHDDHRDAGGVGLRQRRLHDLDLGRRDGDHVDLPLDHVFDDRRPGRRRPCASPASAR